MRGRSSAGHRVPNMAAFAGHVSPCCRLWTHNSSHGRLHSLRMSTHFLCVEAPPRSSKSLLEITARLPAAPHRTRRSARIPALTTARLPLVLVGSRRLSLSLTGALMHVRLGDNLVKISAISAISVTILGSDDRQPGSAGRFQRVLKMR